MAKNQLLLIDDDRNITKNVQRYISIYTDNYVFITAKNGAEGLDVAERHLPVIDAIICDIVMPKMDGVRFVKDLRKLEVQRKHPSIPVIMLTSIEDEEKWKQLTRMDDAHIADYILKPFNDETGVEIIRSLTRLFDKGERDQMIQETKTRGFRRRFELVMDRQRHATTS